MTVTSQASSPQKVFSLARRKRARWNEAGRRYREAWRYGAVCLASLTPMRCIHARRAGLMLQMRFRKERDIVRVPITGDRDTSATRNDPRRGSSISDASAGPCTKAMSRSHRSQPTHGFSDTKRHPLLERDTRAEALPETRGNTLRRVRQR